MNCFDLSQQARELAERTLEIEKEKFKLSGSDIFWVLRFQGYLAGVRNNELNANIDYFNALIRLDRVVGTTLETWQVRVEKRSP
ncbi:MAG TPA: hypothetical protein V6D28_17265 [Leptolyngbyaceae cyanobacterium]